MEAVTVEPPISMRTCAVVCPFFTSTILPLRMLRALSFTETSGDWDWAGDRTAWRGSDLRRRDNAAYRMIYSGAQAVQGGEERNAGWAIVVIGDGQAQRDQDGRGCGRPAGRNGCRPRL